MGVRTFSDFLQIATVGSPRSCRTLVQRGCIRQNIRIRPTQRFLSYLFRHLSSCGILMTRSPRVLCLQDWDTMTAVPQSRNFISLTNKRKEYSERRILGYSMQEMYDVVANVDDYKHFVPWCKKSQTIMKEQVTPKPSSKWDSLQWQCVQMENCSITWRQYGALVLAFPLPSHLHRRLFCKWPPAISFEFRSLLHSQLATMFFDEVVKQNVAALSGGPVRCTAQRLVSHGS
ncbi:hypothetical protein INR49_000102 [Caranx melampygus]|nr:hypothetical protein INR49_000102 [Caranx melampygus]